MINLKEKKGIKTTIVTLIGVLMWILNYISLTFKLIDIDTADMIQKGIFAGVLFFIGLFAKDSDKSHSKNN